MAPKRQRTLVENLSDDGDDDMNQPIKKLRDGARHCQRQPRFNVHIPHVDYRAWGVTDIIKETIMEMSSRSNTSSLDFALDYLNWMDQAFQRCSSRSISIMELDGLYFFTQNLRMDIGLLKTFVLYASNCRRRKHEKYVWEHDQKEGKNIISFRVEDIVYSFTQDLNSAYLRSHDLASDSSNFIREVARFRETIKLFIQKDVGESCITLLDYYSLGDDGDGQLTMDFIDSLLQNLYDLLVKIRNRGRELIYFERTLETLGEKLKFLKSFIGFAALQGVERKQLTDLLIHVEDVAVNAVKLICLCWRLEGNDDERDYNEMRGEVSQLIPKKIDYNEMRAEVSHLIHKKINPVDPQVQETYTHILTASKSSRLLSQALDLEKNKQQLAADFIDCLLDNLIDLLVGSSSSFMVSVKDQMLKLHKGGRFLSILLRQHQAMFNELNAEMKDLIGVVVIDTGIVICSLSVNEMKDCLPKETDLALFHLLKVLKFIMAEVASIYSPSSFSFPRTNELGSIDFLLTNLKEIAIAETNSIAFPAGRIHTIREDLEFLRSFLENIVEQLNQNEKLQILWNHAMEVAYKAELVIDSILVGEKTECLDTIVGDIKLMKIEAQDMGESMRHDSETQNVTKNSTHMASQHSTPALNQILVGRDDEVKTIIDRLTRGLKMLDIVSIVGMAGLGKTTLANKVYNDPSILYCFHVRAWCCVSQVHNKHGLLIQILCSIASESLDQYLMKNEDDLAEQLYKHLKGKRYVIVLDDVWDIDAWSLLSTSFPDDANGSRILVTCRSHNLPLQIKLDSEPHHLRHLTDEESWVLMQSRILGQKGCPPALNGVGMQIAQKCKGLPLTVVVVAGILASTEQDSWKVVADSLSSRTCMNTIELSYKYLPDYLKPCLLYFSAFQEDQEIPVRKLKLLWISEGFVQPTDQIKNVEDVADNYLMDLIHKSLIMVTQQRSLGGVKTCQIHDLVHEFCVAKAKEESFLQIVPASDGPFPFCELYNSHRLSIYFNRAEALFARPRQSFPHLRRLFFPHLRSLLCFSASFWEFKYSHIFNILKLLRVLDLGQIYFVGYFPREVELLVHLRYLAITALSMSIPSAIANLSRLETFIIRRGGSVRLPNTIWTMKKLTHLYVENGFILPIENLDAFPNLYHLESLTLAIDASSESLQKILIKLPSIRRLKCFQDHSGDSTFVLDSLSRLESLKVGYFSVDFSFPLNLKKLTLENYKQPWSEISTIGKLPNLEVLKLLGESFLGDTWEMKEGQFPKLRFLKLEFLDIVRWIASGDNFPPLQKLVLQYCLDLQEVPSCLEEVITIEMIEVTHCHESAVSLVEQIQQQQMDNGNEGLKIIIRKCS